MIGLFVGLILGEAALVALGLLLDSGVYWFVFAVLNVVMIHEAGHFSMAKLFGFKATKFFVGFGPALWSTKRGETEYGIAAIPAGGYVKITGMNPYEEVPEEDVPRSYPNKPRWQRAILLLAGSATHWPVAFVVLTFAFMAIGLPSDKADVNVIDEVRGQTTPASSAGFETGDRIIAVEGEDVSSWDETVIAIREAAGRETDFTVVRDDEELEISATPGRALFDEQGSIVAYAETAEELRAPREGETEAGFLGVSPEQVFETKSLFPALAESGRWTWDITTGSFKELGNVFTPVFNGELLDAVRGEADRPEGVGLVGAGRIASQQVARGQWLEFFYLIAVLTIFIGIMNLLPLPPLDGGHLAILAYEKVTGKVVDIRKLIPVAAAVISFFLIMFIAFLYLDIANPIEVPF